VPGRRRARLRSADCRRAALSRSPSERAPSSRPSSPRDGSSCAASARSKRAQASSSFKRVWRNMAEPPGRAARSEARSSVAPVMAITGAPCVRDLGTTIAPRRRAMSRQTL
jgi:hypothetical protein